jgi:glycosyltransferase involved in cell wall biosynthesis
MSLSVIIPSANRPALLRRQLMSIVNQPLWPDDEVIVAGDEVDGPQPEIATLCAEFGAQYLGVPAAAHDYGHTQINEAMRQARGRWLTFNDDDDIYAPGAFAAMRRAIAAQTTPTPILFRFMAHFGRVVWHTRGDTRRSHIGGHCIVCPNDPARLGDWTQEYEGDHSFVVGTLNHYDLSDWRNEVIAIARPMFGWRRFDAPRDAETLRQMRNAGRALMTRHTEEISPAQQAAWIAGVRNTRIYMFETLEGATVGAALARYDGERTWLTTIVHPDHYNSGAGVAIDGWMCANQEIWAEVRTDHEAARRALTAAGYKIVEDRGEVLIMRGAPEDWQ